MHKLLSAMVAMVTLCFGPVISGSSAAQAQEVHNLIRPSLVYLTAKGKTASQDVVTYATGFLVSSDGLVLTTYHLISELGEVVPKTVTIEAKIREKNANFRLAMIVDASINTDLLLLKIPPGTKEYAKVSLGSAQSHDDADPIYTSGFPETITYRKQDTKIEAREGQGGHLWTTGLKSEKSQRGSPIYNAAGEVIGVLKGEKDGTTSSMIPIGYADSLLAQVRLREIQKELQDFESLRHSINWAGNLKKDSEGKKIIIIYKKMIAGKPHVKEIDLQVKVMGEINNRKIPLTNKDLNYPKLKLKGLISKTEGVFEIPELCKDVELIKKTLQVDEVFYLKAYITATLTDGTSLPSTKIKISYDRED